MKRPLNTTHSAKPLCGMAGYAISRRVVELLIARLLHKDVAVALRRLTLCGCNNTSD